jgi:hypothetical protein
MRYLTLILLCSTLFAQDTYFFEPVKRWNKKEINWSAPSEFQDILTIQFAEWEQALNGVLTFKQVDKGGDIFFTPREDLIPYFDLAAFVRHWTEADSIVRAEVCVVRPLIGNIDTILSHEIGHVLGLGHFDNPNSIMYHRPMVKELHKEDIEAVCALYNTSALVPNFNIKAIKIKGKKYRLTIDSEEYVLWTSLKTRKWKKDIISVFAATGNEVICTVKRYPYELRIDVRGYTQYLTIVKEK